MQEFQGLRTLFLVFLLSAFLTFSCSEDGEEAPEAASTCDDTALTLNQQGAENSDNDGCPQTVTAQTTTQSATQVSTSQSSSEDEEASADTDPDPVVVSSSSSSQASSTPVIAWG